MHLEIGLPMPEGFFAMEGERYPQHRGNDLDTAGSSEAIRRIHFRKGDRMRRGSGWRGAALRTADHGRGSHICAVRWTRWAMYGNTRAIRISTASRRMRRRLSDILGLCLFHSRTEYQLV